MQLNIYWIVYFLLHYDIGLQLNLLLQHVFCFGMFVHPLMLPI